MISCHYNYVHMFVRFVDCLLMLKSNCHKCFNMTYGRHLRHISCTPLTTLLMVILTLRNGKLNGKILLCVFLFCRVPRRCTSLWRPYIKTGLFCRTVWPGGYKTFFILNSSEHEILNAHKYENITNFSIFHAQISLECNFSCS